MNELTNFHPLSAVGYQIRVWLVGIEPVIQRRLLTGHYSTFADLHQTIQVALCWSGDEL